MTRQIYCVKLNKKAEGLEYQSYPGALGEKIFNSISQIAWQQWLAHQTMLINEYRLSMVDLEARQFLVIEMEKFLFGTGSEAPAGYMAPPGEGLL